MLMAVAMQAKDDGKIYVFGVSTSFNDSIVYISSVQVLLPYIMDNEPKIILFMRNYIFTDSRPYQKVERKCDRSLYK